MRFGDTCRRLVIGAFCVALAGATWAQLPAVRSAGEIRYLSGGVGDDEELDIRRAAGDFGVLLEFAEVERGSNHGKWSADIDVVVRNATRTLLATRTVGPLLLMRLAPGVYSVDATRAGVKQTRRIEVRAGKPVRERYFWIIEAPLK